MALNPRLSIAQTSISEFQTFDEDGSLSISEDLSFAPRNVVFTPSGRILSFANCIFAAFKRSGQLIGEQMHNFSWLKSACATDKEDEFIVVEQNTDTIYRIKIDQEGAVWTLWSTEEVGPRPRGVVYATDHSVWVACKNNNFNSGDDQGYVFKLDGSNGDILGFTNAPFGLRGICEGRPGEFWVTQLGEMHSNPKIGGGQGEGTSLLLFTDYDVDDYEEIEVGRGGFGVCAEYDGDGHAYVVCATDGEVYKVHPDNGVISTFEVGDGPLSITWNQDGQSFWVSHKLEGLLLQLSRNGEELNSISVEDGAPETLGPWSHYDIFTRHGS